MNKFSKALQKQEEEKRNKAKQKQSVSDSSSAPSEKREEIKPGTYQPVTPKIETVVDRINVDPSIVALHDPRSRISEQYRVLRTNLRTGKRKALKTILLSSSVEGEGKTVSAINMAFTLAQDKTKRVLLIDADLRRSKVSFYLGLKNHNVGFRHVLEGSVNLEDAMVGTEYPNLHIVPGLMDGNVANAAELLESQMMRKVLARTKDTYDYVIIDSPPIIPVTDAAVIGKQVDGVLLVFKASATARNTITHAQHLFEQAEVDLLGYVMTHVEYISPGYRDYYYYSYN